MLSLDWKDDAPIRRLAIPFVEDFRQGLKMVIDEAEAVDPAPAEDAR